MSGNQVSATATRHRLDWSHFEAIAAGGGDDEALDALCRAELSKRLLLLRDVRLHTALGEACGPAWALLDAAMRHRPAAAQAVLARPFMDVWASRLLRGGSTQVEESVPGETYLIGVAGAAGVAAGIEFELALPSGVRTLVLPGIGRLSDLPGPGRLCHDGETLALDDGSSTSPTPTTELGGRWSPRRTVHCPGRTTHLSVEIEDLDPLRDCFGLPVRDRLPEGRFQADRLAHLLPSAWELIEADFNRYLPTVARGVRLLVPIDAAGGGSVSASHDRTFGAVAISTPADAGELALLMVHEAQHAKLSALLDLFPLTNPACTQLFHAPWRTDPRPATALLQGIYAHVAVADFWRIRRERLADDRARSADFEYAFWRDQCRRAVDSLAGSTALTELGEAFVERLAHRLDRWPGVADDRLSLAVSHCTTVTDVQWRLHNHDVPGDRLAELVAAYRDGTPSGELWTPEIRATASRPASAAMAGRLVRQLRQRAVDPTAASGVAADEASGDDPAAASGDGAGRADPALRVVDLDRRLVVDPDQPGLWAALALELVRCGAVAAARVLQDRPEVVRAMLVDLVASGEPNAAASVVAGWLASGTEISTGAGRYRS